MQNSVKLNYNFIYDVGLHTHIQIYSMTNNTSAGIY
jgi:hypothetical protein